jgi:hypothetical protein
MTVMDMDVAQGGRKGRMTGVLKQRAIERTNTGSRSELPEWYAYKLIRRGSTVGITKHSGWGKRGPEGKFPKERAVEI